MLSVADVAVAVRAPVVTVRSGTKVVVTSQATPSQPQRVIVTGDTGIR